MFLGSAAGLPTLPTVVLAGVNPGDRFGYAVAGAGDITGDGFADIVVGARDADPGGRVNAGTASVFFGTATGVSRTAHRVLEGSLANDNFGAWVASASGGACATRLVCALLSDASIASRARGVTRARSMRRTLGRFRS